MSREQSTSGGADLPGDRGIDTLQVAGLTLHGVSRGGVETCLMVKELGVMFDVGMCPPGCTRYEHVLVSHGHADHLGGVVYLATLRAMYGMRPLQVHAPEELIAPLGRVIDAWAEIEDHRAPLVLHGHAPGDRVRLGREIEATCLRTVHRVPSLAWVIERVSRRLRPEFRGLPGAELKRLRTTGTELTQTHRSAELCVTGDTQIEFLLLQREQPQGSLALQARVLVHEVTSWQTGDEDARARTRRWGHTHVDELLELADAFTGEALVLVHRSMRHARRDIEAVVNERFPPALREKVHVFGN